MYFGIRSRVLMKNRFMGWLFGVGKADADKVDY